jgi:phosphoribosylaminoimidazolecarboxamide formyltransferase/IMP cyclohydrolase
MNNQGMRAILSISDKTGLVEFARGLVELGVEVYSTGGTHSALTSAGIPVRRLSDLTGFPEILDGRVKTLHPGVHGGILARRDRPEHLEELARHGLQTIDLVACNLYPFVETVSKAGVSLEEALENIDIGGPTLLRAAAKNFPHVLVVVDPDDYGPLLDSLRAGAVPFEERRRLAQKAFQHVALYDTAIAGYLRGLEESEEGAEKAAKLPEAITIGLRKRLDLRYGENPHQQAALYLDQSLPGARGGIATANQLHGKEISYNNIVDADAAWQAVSDFEECTVAVVKHTNPCGLASHPDQTEAYRRALAGDPVSAYGGIVAVNRPLSAEMAHEMASTFYEVVVAPAYEEEALALLRKKRNLRVLQVTGATPAAGMQYRQVSGGALLQEEDRTPDSDLSLRTVTKREPAAGELRDLRFAWRAVKHVKSNAIVLAREQALVGMGAGQPNRVTSVYLALRAAGERSRGSVLASDAFFPFPDSVELAAQGGVTAIIQPGGSIRDEEVIKAADDHGIAMVFTGTRHFRH